MSVFVESFDNEPKKLWIKGALLTSLVFLTMEIYSRTKFKDRVNEITHNRFNIVLL